MALNVLVVDDSETVRAVLAKTFQLAGIPVNEFHQAANGKEGLGILTSHWIDLVLSDINMPIMSGIEMVEAMQQDDLLKTIPVIIITTEGSKTRIEQLKAKGVVAYIRKPFTPEMVRNVVDEVLGGIHVEQ